MALLLHHQVPASGWRLWADLLFAGLGLGLLLAGALTRAWRTAAPGALFVAAALASLRWAPSQPGVLLIVVDCLGADRFTDALMPQTRARLDDAWHFTDARAQSSWTRSAVPSLLTGRYPVEHGVYRLEPPDRLRPGIPTLAQAFDDAGFATAAFINQAQLDPAFGLAAGFHRYGHRDGDATSIHHHFQGWHRFFRHVPRFAYLHYLDIHKPYRPAPAFAPPRPAGLSLTDAELADQAGLMTAVNTGRRQLSPADRSYLEQLHEAEIRQLDAALGTLLDQLSADGSLDRSFVVLTSDHGEAFATHGWLTHGGLPYDELLHIPLVIRPPGGLAAHRDVATPIQHVDVLPTLLGLVGVAAPDGVSGRDLGPMLDAGAVEGATGLPRPTFAEYFAHDDHVVSVRTGDLHFIHGGGQEQLFDLATDPAEAVDLARARPDDLARLRNIGAAYLATGLADGDLRTMDWQAAAGTERPWPTDNASGVDAAPAHDSVETLRALGYIE